MEYFWVQSLDNRLYGIAQLVERKPEQNGFLAYMVYTDGVGIFTCSEPVGLTYNWIIGDATKDKWEIIQDLLLIKNGPLIRAMLKGQ